MHNMKTILTAITLQIGTTATKSTKSKSQFKIKQHKNRTHNIMFKKNRLLNYS